MGFLTEDRKESGCFLLLDITANMQAAILRRGYTRAGFVSEGEIKRLCSDPEDEAARAHARPRGAGASIFPAAISRRC